MKRIHFIQMCLPVMVCILLGGCTPSGEREDPFHKRAAELYRKDVDAVMRRLRSENPEERAGAADDLGFLGKHAVRAVPTLLECLEKEEDNDVKEAIIKALGYIGDGRAVPILAGIKAGGTKALGFIAAGGIDEESRQSAIDVLIEMAQSNDEVLKAHAIDDLCRTGVGKYEGVREIIKLSSADPSPRVRRCVASGCRKVLGKESEETLKRLLKDDDKEVMVSAAVELTEAGDPSALSIMEEVLFGQGQLYDRYRGRCLLALENVSGEESIRILKRWMIEMYGRPNPCLDTAHRILSKKGIRLPWPPRKAAEYLRDEEVKVKQETSGEKE